MWVTLFYLLQLTTLFVPPSLLSSAAGAGHLASEQLVAAPACDIAGVRITPVTQLRIRTLIRVCKCAKFLVL